MTGFSSLDHYHYHHTRAHVRCASRGLVRIDAAVEYTRTVDHSMPMEITEAALEDIIMNDDSIYDYSDFRSGFLCTSSPVFLD